MTEKQVVVTYGLEARYAALFVQTASKFESKIQVKLAEKTVNAKSIMGIISLGILSGDTVTIVAEGADSEKVCDELCAILTNKDNG